MAGFCVKIACFAIGDHIFTYHFSYNMVSGLSELLTLYLEQGYRTKIKGNSKN
jgi:hypothetical protein